MTSVSNTSESHSAFEMGSAAYKSYRIVIKEKNKQAELPYFRSWRSGVCDFGNVPGLKLSVTLRFSLLENVTP